MGRARSVQNSGGNQNFPPSGWYDSLNLLTERRHGEDCGARDTGELPADSPGSAAVLVETKR